MDADLFDPSDVTWEVVETKRRDKINILLTSTEGSMNLMKTYLALKLLTEKLEVQLGIMERAKGEH